MRLSTPAITSGSAAQWASPVLLSVAVHLSLAAGYVFLEDAYTPPRPPSILAMEVVLMQDAPGAGAVQPAEPATSVANVPPAPAADAPMAEPEAASATAEPASIKRPEEAPEPAAFPVIAALPESPPDLAEVAPLPVPEKIQVALHAPLPKPKPVLSPRPIGLAEKAVSNPEPLAADRSTGDHPTGRKPATGPGTAPARIASAASAGAATAKLIPPRYAAPGRGNPLPVYPRTAKRRGIEGRLVLRVRVDAKGLASKIDVVESSGHGLLDAAAERAVRKWYFEPARRAGIPVIATIDVPVVFRLRD